MKAKRCWRTVIYNVKVLVFCPGLVVHHEVHDMCTCVLCLYTFEYAYACILVRGQYIYLHIRCENQKEILSVSCSISQVYCIEVKTH